MARRLHIPSLRTGQVRLADEPAHHARDVLRLEPGTPVELFNDAGNTAAGTLLRITPREVVAEVGEVNPSPRGLGLTIASAIPKGPRTDWMIEKLSEIGVDRFIPLATSRAVVLPEGPAKAARWQRLATEAARQSRRAGVMTIDPLTALEPVIRQGGNAAKFFAATEQEGRPLPRVMMNPPQPITIFIGPEGGWSDDERLMFQQNGLTPISLGASILRTETAAIVAAGVVAAFATRRP